MKLKRAKEKKRLAIKKLYLGALNILECMIRLNDNAGASHTYVNERMRKLMLVYLIGKFY